MLRDLFNPTNNTAAVTAGVPARTATPHGSDTVLGASARMIGTLTTDGSVSLSDHFEGSILAGGTVLLGAQSRLDGDLVCDTAIVEGQVRGNVTARQVSVLSSGQILGDLCVEKLATEEGSVVQGMVTLQDALDIDEARRVAARQVAIDAGRSGRHPRPA